MGAAAPRIDERLIAALVRLDKARPPIAETHRRLGLVADHLGVPRPSYEQVRSLVHEVRLRRRRSEVGDILLDIAFQKRPPEAIIELFLP